MANSSFINLPIAACYLIDLPKSGEDCSTNNPTECIQCMFQGTYLTKSCGHVISLIIWVMTLLVGGFAVLGNLLIIVILKKKNKRTAFDMFLIGLATCDLISSFFAMVHTTATTTHLNNWSRGPTTLYSLYFGMIAYVGRSGSAFMTVAISIERFLVVVFPIKFHGWFTNTKTQFIIFFTGIWAIWLSLPCFSVAVVPNTFGKNITSIEHLDYIFVGTRFARWWYSTLGALFDQIDFWAPLPLLLFFNGLVYYQIRKLTARRNVLTNKHWKDIKTAKMFFPVVFILFICNTVPMINIFFLSYGILSRELALGTMFSFTVNSAVNLPIYYFGGSSFKKKVGDLMAAYFPFCRKDSTNESVGDSGYITNSKGPTTTSNG